MNDFPDWFSPIIVKELRQGLRSKVFVSSLFALQVAMLVGVFMALGAANHYWGLVVNDFFWAMVGALMVLTIIACTVNAISGEIVGNTFDLLILTNLSPWKIAVGKWAAIFLQTVLLLTTLCPYVALRYFLGGVNLLTELIYLTAVIACGAFLAAVGVAASSTYYRPLLQLVFCAFFITILGFLSKATTVGFDLRSLNPWIWPTMILSLTPLLILLVLEVCVVKISPLGVNSVWRKRLLAIAVLLVSIAIAASFDAWSLLVFVLLIFVVPISLGGLFEITLPIPALYQPFLLLKKWPRFNRSAGLLFQPSMTGGLLFSILVILAFLPFLNWNYTTIFSAIAAVYAPAALARKVAPFSAWTAYLVIQAFGIIFPIILSFFGRETIVLAGFHPISLLIVRVTEFSTNPEKQFLMLIFTGGAFAMAISSMVQDACKEQKRIAFICSGFTPSTS